MLAPSSAVIACLPLAIPYGSAGRARRFHTCTNQQGDSDHDGIGLGASGSQWPLETYSESQSRMTQKRPRRFRLRWPRLRGPRCHAFPGRIWLIAHGRMRKMALPWVPRGRPIGNIGGYSDGIEAIDSAGDGAAFNSLGDGE